MPPKKPAPRKASAKKAPSKKTAAKRPAPKKDAAVETARATPEGTMPAGGEGVVLSFIQELAEPQRTLVARLHRVFMDAASDLEVDIKSNMPVYSRGEMVGYIAPFPKHVNFGLFRGGELRDPPPEGLGGNRHVKVRSVEDIDTKRFSGWVKQAVTLEK